MRILFVCGGAGGGAAISTHELAGALAAHGDTVAVLQARRAALLRRIQRRALNAKVKLGASRWATPAAALSDSIGRRPAEVRAATSVRQWMAAVPENALARVAAVFAPDVVVANSVDRASWRAIHETCDALARPVVLYIREESSLGHLDGEVPAPDAVVANARALADRAAAHGLPTAFVPSMIDLTRTRVESTRQRVVYVNPIELNGVEIAFALAATCPEIAFAFVESWRLDNEARAALEARAREHPNIELRPRFDDARRVYADASVVLAPCLTDTRPRVVLEAQDNGIPVVASDFPSLRECVGDGGITVDVDAGVGRWAEALRSVLAADRYPALCAAASSHAARSEVQPDAIVGAFRSLLADVEASRSRGARD
jgi:glycosyltransferase involved in cell wall biosynthesis